MDANVTVMVLSEPVQINDKAMRLAAYVILGDAGLIAAISYAPLLQGVAFGEDQNMPMHVDTILTKGNVIHLGLSVPQTPSRHYDSKGNVQGTTEYIHGPAEAARILGETLARYWEVCDYNVNLTTVTGLAYPFSF